MTRDETIDNMAELMCDQCENTNCIEDGHCDGVIEYAMALYEAGYRYCGEGEWVSIEWHNEQILHAEQEIEKLENEIWDMQDKLGCYHSEIKRQRKQAKIEVLETIRQQLTDNGALTVKIAITIDEFMDKIKGETEQ